MQQDLDERVWASPEYEVGRGRHAAAVRKIEKSDGTVYFPELSNIQSLDIGARAKIHSHVWIGKKVKIEEDALIQAFVFIPDNVTIGKGVFLGPHVTFTNEKHIMSGIWQSTAVGDHACIGAGAVILPGVTIGPGAIIGAGAVVTKDVPANQTWVGNPARHLPAKDVICAKCGRPERVNELQIECGCPGR